MRIFARYKLSSPCFQEDAGQGLRLVDARAERVGLRAHSIRPPSVIGAVQRWWRATKWARLIASAGGHSEGDTSCMSTALAALKQCERRLFGTAAQPDGSGGQGLAKFTVRTQGVRAVGAHELRREGWDPGEYGLQYLAGQGLVARINSQVQWCRDAFVDGALTIEAILPERGGASPEDAVDVACALWLLGMFGGIGTASRSGWGSLSLQDLLIDGLGANPPWLSVPQSLDDWHRCVSAVSDAQSWAAADQYPPFTALSRQTWLQCHGGTGLEAPALLSECGWSQAKYRSNGKSYGSGPRMVGPPRKGVAVERLQSTSLPRFWGDHVLLERALRQSLDSSDEFVQVDVPPARLVFGAPHPYFFSSKRQGVDVTAFIESGTEPIELRRASPVFIHVHRFPDGGVGLAQALLPSQFLPHGAKIFMRRHLSPDESGTKEVIEDGRIPRALRAPADRVNWVVLCSYMDRFNDLPGFSRVLPTSPSH